MLFSQDGYYDEYDTTKVRHVFSVRGWCNYEDSSSTVEDPFGVWIGQRCPGVCCMGGNHDTEHTSHENLIVGVHGATRGDGIDCASYMGIGIHFGDGNPYNESYYVELLDKLPIQPATQRAEVSAATSALQQVFKIQTGMLKHRIDKQKNKAVKGLSAPLLRVIIKTDSDYLTKSMNDWLQKRRDTRYLTSVGTPITNRDVLETLDRWACLLEKGGCQVIFWSVAVEKNAAAEDLANEALDRAA